MVVIFMHAEPEAGRKVGGEGGVAKAGPAL